MIIPKCERASCFACVGGLCRVLTDNGFRGKLCPFYKNKNETQSLEARAKACRAYALTHPENGNNVRA